jgi:hypothetical protein
METIIRRAIEGGYKNGHIWGVEDGNYILKNENGDRYGSISVEQIILDPLFWQALQKSFDWSEGYMRQHYRQFFELNLTESFDAAISWLQALVDTK